MDIFRKLPIEFPKTAANPSLLNRYTGQVPGIQAPLIRSGK
jgi:hypothetical protein